MTNLTRIAWNDCRDTAPRPAQALQERRGARDMLALAAVYEREGNATGANAARFWAANHLRAEHRHRHGIGTPLA